MPNNSGFSLEEVQLPVEDREKPADGIEIKADLTPGTPAPAVTPEPTPAPAATDTNVGTTPDAEPKPGETTPETPPAEPPAATPEPAVTTDPNQPPATPAPETPPLTPFHEHPDWKKMQTKVEEAERQAREAKQQLEESRKAADPYNGMTPEQVAEAKVRQEVKDGKLKAEDELTLNRRFTEVLNEERTARQAKADQAAATQSAQIVEQVNQKYESLGITDPAEKEKVKSLVLGWAEKGMNISLATFDIAAENLRLKGEIKAAGQPAVTPAAPAKPSAPTPTAEGLAKEKADAEAKKQANAQIATGQSSGDKSNAKKPTQEYLRSRNLDDITADLVNMIQ